MTLAELIKTNKTIHKSPKMENKIKQSKKTAGKLNAVVKIIFSKCHNTSFTSFLVAYVGYVPRQVQTSPARLVIQC